MTEAELIHGCSQNPADRKAQEVLYQQYAAQMFGLCRRYVGNREDAEDVMVTGFFKVLKNIKSFAGKGSFEGWMKRIMVNEALMFLRRQDAFRHMMDITELEVGKQQEIEAELGAEDIKRFVEGLAPGYRTVFNLYVVEGYKHREIAEMLGISINTSKSQLILVKKKLRELITREDLSAAG